MPQLQTVFSLLCRLPNEWVPLEQVAATKTVRLSLLPAAAKSRLQQELLLAAPPPLVVPPFKQPRKNKRVEPPSVFLTPDEVAASAAVRRLFPSEQFAGDEFRHPAAFSHRPSFT